MMKIPRVSPAQVGALVALAVVVAVVLGWLRSRQEFGDYIRELLAESLIKWAVAAALLVLFGPLVLPVAAAVLGALLLFTQTQGELVRAAGVPLPAQLSGGAGMPDPCEPAVGTYWIGYADDGFPIFRMCEIVSGGE